MTHLDLMGIKKVDKNGTENESKLFRQIEAIIDGILEFILRFIRTTVFLTRHPIRLKQLIAVDERTFPSGHSRTLQ